MRVFVVVLKLESGQEIEAMYRSLADAKGIAALIWAADGLRARIEEREI